MKVCFNLNAILALMGVLVCAASAWAGGQVVLSRQGKATMPIVVGEMRSLDAIRDYQSADLDSIDPTTAEPSLRLERAVGALAQYLGRIGDSTFTVEHGEGNHGIVVGLYSDFPEQDFGKYFDVDDPLRQEEYFLKSNANGLQIIGATEQALENAVWGLLFRLGYRQYFPGPLWEYIPELNQVAIDVDTFQSPDFHSRLIWYGSGAPDHARVDYHNWCQRNRAVAGLRVNTSHEYWKIVGRNRQEFLDHPEYYAMVDGERGSRSHAKFNVTSSGLKNLVVDDAIRWFEENPEELTKSMDPTDHGGWDESEEAKAIGRPSDQALLLANLVAKSATEHFGSNRYVGMYAYFQHQAAPKHIEPHANVIVSFATRFLFTGRTVEALMETWRQSGLRLMGIREYYGCHYFDYGLPRLSVQGASLGYIRDSIPEYYRNGARFFTAESTNDWGMLGLGHFIATRLLWDIDDAGRVDAYSDEFVENMFGSAVQPMTEFFDILNGENRALLSSRQTIGRLYELLSNARVQSEDDSPLVRQRIDAFILYIRYVELLNRCIESEGEQAQIYYGQAIQLAYRMRQAYLASLNGFINNRRNSISGLKIPKEARWQVPERENPWKSNDPVTDQEIQDVLTRAKVFYRELNDQDSALPAKGMSWTGDDQDAAVLFRRLQGDLRVIADAGEQVSIVFKTRIMNIGFGPTYIVIDPSGNVIRRGRIDVTKQDELAWVAEKAGVYRVLMEANFNAVRFSSNNRVRVYANGFSGVHGEVNLIKPRGELYFWVPAGETSLDVRVAGQGGSERVRAWLISPDRQVVEEQDQISGDTPHTFKISAEHREHGGVWSIRFDEASSGHFEDVFLTLPSEVPQWLSQRPDALIRESQ